MEIVAIKSKMFCHTYYLYDIQIQSQIVFHSVDYDDQFMLAVSSDDISRYDNDISKIFPVQIAATVAANAINLHMYFAYGFYVCTISYVFYCFKRT